MWPQRLPEVHDDDELVLVTEKPLCLQGLRTGLHERIQRYGGLVILRKVVQFTHLTSGTGQGVEESAFAFYGPSFPSDRYPNNNWGHFEGTNGSSTYNCRGPTTAYMVVGPTGLRDRLETYMDQCRTNVPPAGNPRSVQGHRWPHIHVTKGQEPARDGNGTYMFWAVHKANSISTPPHRLIWTHREREYDVLVRLPDITPPGDVALPALSPADCDFVRAVGSRRARKLIVWASDEEGSAGTRPVKVRFDGVDARLTALRSWQCANHTSRRVVARLTD